MVEPGRRVDLTEHPPDDRLGFRDRDEIEEETVRDGERLANLTTRLAAGRRNALLVILQGLDASGKDGTAKGCLGPVNPMAIKVASFKAPTSTELAHDFLWRCARELPERGQVGVWNRSHYEDVLVVRVDHLVPEEVWRPRYDTIVAWERHLVHEGTVILKFFLHISRKEQAERFRARIADPTKNWKFSPEDLVKRERWDDYIEAYREMLERTSTEWAPWYVIPADRKWVRNAVVTRIMIQALEGLDLEWPPLDPAVLTLKVV
jgi:PPK2 family polyphosphate:nucleotide phosphotransferase